MSDFNEPMAVVEYTATEAAATLKADTMTSRYLTSFDQERLDAAMGTIGRWATGTGSPAMMELVVEDEAKKQARKADWDMAHIHLKMASGFLNYGINSKSSLGRVNLDLMGEAWLTDEDEPDAEALALQPVVMFGSLSTLSPYYEAGVRVAAAFWYQPHKTYRHTYVNKTTGEVRYSIRGGFYDTEENSGPTIPPAAMGLLGVARWYSTVNEAVVDHKALQQAMRTYHAQLRLLERGGVPVSDTQRAEVKAERRAASPEPRWA